MRAVEAAAVQPSANARGYTDKVIPQWNRRTRPIEVDCRAMIFTEGLPALALLAQAFETEERFAGVATALTQLVHGPVTWGISYDLDALRREIYRWLSMGPDQSTTFIDEILRQHREWVRGGEEGPFAKLGEVLHHLKFFRYEERGEETHCVVDGEVMAQLRAICVALTSEHSHLTRMCHIETVFLAFFNVTVGDEELRELLIFVFAHCLYGAAGMAVALKLLKRFRKQLPAVAFDEDLMEARRALVLALDGGVEATIATAVASFKTAWAVVEDEAAKAYPHEQATALFDQMRSVDLPEHMNQLDEVLDVLATTTEPVMVFVLPKDMLSYYGQKPKTLNILRCRFEPGDTTTGLEGLRKLNNAQALSSNPVALLVAVGNYCTSGDVRAKLMDYMSGCGAYCQAASYADTTYWNRGSSLLASIQCDVALFIPSQSRWVVARRRGEAALVHALRQKVQFGPSGRRIDLHAVETARLRKGEWCCKGYFAQVYSFEAMARDAGYESVHEFLQDARNSYDVTEMRAVRQFRREARLFGERFVPMKDALRAKHLATMARRAARTLAGQEKGGRLSRTTVVLAGTQWYDANGALRDSAPGGMGVFGARVSFVGWRRWSSKDELIDWLCDEGADVTDYALTTGTEELTAFLGSSESIAQLRDQNYLCLVADNWPAPRTFTKVTEVLQRFVIDGRCYRESVMDRFFVSGAGSFFDWGGRDDCTVFEGRMEEIDDGQGSTSRRLVRRARATGPGGAPYQIGVDPALVRRSTRQVPAPAPAAEPASSDEEMDESNSLRGAEPPKWPEGGRTWTALEKIFSANPELISKPPPDFRARRAIAKRLCPPDGSAPSTAPDDVRLRKKTFRWGDDQWIAWHDANDVDSEEEEEGEEEPADDDPFAERNVPRACRENGPELRSLFKQRFGTEPKTCSESRIFTGDFLDWVRYKITHG